MFNRIRTDLSRYSGNPDAGAGHVPLHTILTSFGLHATITYRFGRWLVAGQDHALRWLRLLLYPVYWLMSSYVRFAYGIRLEMSADIGPGLLLWHFGGVRLRNCRLGEYCTIHQRVTIGPSGSERGPWIGDRVWVGPHARVEGSYSVGSGATIGAGTVIDQDVPESAVVIGNPGRIVNRNHDNSRLLGLRPQATLSPQSHAGQDS